MLTCGNYSGCVYSCNGGSNLWQKQLYDWKSLSRIDFTLRSFQTIKNLKVNGSELWFQLSRVSI